MGMEKAVSEEIHEMESKVEASHSTIGNRSRVSF
jgi:hypothetical protein